MALERTGLLFLLLWAVSAAPSVAQITDVRSMSPYFGAIVIDAETGDILKEDHAGAQGYPASMIKLVNLAVVLDEIKAGNLDLADPVVVSREVAQVGGRQVWLREGEVFPLEELLYAMMVHSANDAAAAVAIRASGSRDAHAAKMTAMARDLNLRNTAFHNVHGLPPGPGQLPDTTSALDMARLARWILDRHPEVLRYTSVSTRPFREGNPVQLTSSNKLLETFPGCDGLKTGFFSAGGFSTVVTAERDGRRVIAVILGSREARVRDQMAAEWLEVGFARLPPKPIQIIETVFAPVEDLFPEEEAPPVVPSRGRSLVPWVIALFVVAGAGMAVVWRVRSAPRG